MPQTLKAEVRDAILRGAAAAFAASGYLGCTMASIARAAGVSTGNVYRYFAGKRELFEAVVDEAFVAHFEALLDARVATLAQLPDLRSLDGEAARRQGELLGFWLAHRLQVVIVLDRAEGTRWEGFGDRFVQRLVDLTRADLQAHAGRPLTAAEELVLNGVFNGTRRTLVSILEAPLDDQDRASAFATFWSYQLAGLAGLRQGVRP